MEGTKRFIAASEHAELNLKVVTRGNLELTKRKFDELCDVPTIVTASQNALDNFRHAAFANSESDDMFSVLLTTPPSFL